MAASASGRYLALLAVLLVASLSLSGPVLGQSSEDDVPPAPMRPDELLREGIDRLTRFLAANKTAGPEEIHRFLDRDIAPYFDFSYMARWASGGWHRRLDDGQKRSLTLHLRRMFLSALARNLGSYVQPPPGIEIAAPVRGRSSNEIAVFADVTWAEGFTIRLEFRYYWSPQGWRIFDVAANGSSAVGYYRRYYTEQLRRHGPDKLLGTS